MIEDDDGRVPWLKVFVCAGCYAAPAMLVVAPALLDPTIVAGTGWTAAALTLASSLVFVASAPGSLLGAGAADKHGRLPLALGMTVATGACLVCGAAMPATRVGAAGFVAARALGGFVSGGAAPTCFTWAMELTPRSARVRAATGMNVIWVGGPLYVAVAHVACARLGWRVEVLCLALFCVAFAALARAFVPESPDFLRARDARRAPPTAGPEVYGLVGEDADPPSDAALPLEGATLSDATRPPLERLFRDPRTRAPLVKLVGCWACVSASYYGLTYCAGALSTHVVANFVLLNVADVPGYFLAGALTKRAGGRSEPVMVAFATAAGASLLGLAMGAPPTLFGLFGKFCTAGMFQQIYTMTTDRFDADVRATAFGACRVSAMLATFSSPPLAALPLAVAALVFAAFCAVVAATTLALGGKAAPTPAPEDPAYSRPL